MGLCFSKIEPSENIIFFSSGEFWGRIRLEYLIKFHRYDWHIWKILAHTFKLATYFYIPVYFKTIPGEIPMHF